MRGFWGAEKKFKIQKAKGKWKDYLKFALRHLPLDLLARP
jgi:hypothetical protein